MCGDNYPPGVTGKEPYFDPVPDQLVCVECDRLFNNDQDGAEMCPRCVDMLT